VSNVASNIHVMDENNVSQRIMMKVAVGLHAAALLWLSEASTQIGWFLSSAGFTLPLQCEHDGLHQP
jgi:hypothetical protein